MRKLQICVLIHDDSVNNRYPANNDGLSNQLVVTSCSDQNGL